MAWDPGEAGARRLLGDIRRVVIEDVRLDAKPYPLATARDAMGGGRYDIDLSRGVGDRVVVPEPGQVWAINRPMVRWELLRVEDEAAARGGGTGVTGEIPAGSALTARNGVVVAAGPGGLGLLGREELRAPGDEITVAGLPAREYLRIAYALISGGTELTVDVFLNNDRGSGRYARSWVVDNAALNGDTSDFRVLSIATGTGNRLMYSEVPGNIATIEKSMYTFAMRMVAGASYGNREEHVGKWLNTTDQITRIDVVNSGAGSFQAGSYVAVYGSSE
jgi:hypothetical protein